MARHGGKHLFRARNEIPPGHKFIGALKNVGQSRGDAFKIYFTKLNYRSHPRCCGGQNRPVVDKTDLPPPHRRRIRIYIRVYHSPSLQRGPNNLYVRGIVAVMCIWREGASLIRGQASGSIPPYSIDAHTQARTHTHIHTVMLAQRCRGEWGGNGERNRVDREERE